MEKINSNEIIFRDAQPKDSIELAKLYNEVYGGGYPLKECLDPKSIKQTIEEEKLIWLVSLNKSLITGAIGSQFNEWNNSYESCRGATLKHHRKEGIFTDLYKKLLKKTFNQKNCDLMYGYPRSKTIQEIFERENPPTVTVGTDFGMHLVSEFRETHLFYLLFNPYKKINRITDSNPISNRFLGLSNILNKFNFVNKRDKYPKQIIVGPNGNYKYESNHGKISYNYTAPSKSTSITSAYAEDDEGIIKTIQSYLNNSNELLGHVSFFLLANKKNLYRKLTTNLDRPFHLSAYLPAWYLENGKRYDCLNMAIKLGEKEPNKLFNIEKEVEFFQKMYSS